MIRNNMKMICGIDMAVDPYKTGFCDGLFGREFENPYGWNKKLSMIAYQKGFYAGYEYRIATNITLKIERKNDVA